MRLKELNKGIERLLTDELMFTESACVQSREAYRNSYKYAGYSKVKMPLY